MEELLATAEELRWAMEELLPTADGLRWAVEELLPTGKLFSAVENRFFLWENSFYTSPVETIAPQKSF